MTSRNNHFDAPISQTDKVLFCLDACCLSAENGERASLKSVTKIRHPKILNQKKRSIKNKKKQQKTATTKKKKKKERKKKLPVSEDRRHDTRVCISMNWSVEVMHNERRVHYSVSHML